MSFFGRLGKIASATGGAMGDYVGFHKDVALAIWEPQSFDNFTHEIGEAVKKRGMSGLENTIGPEGMIGAAIGGHAEAVRGPGRRFLEGTERLYGKASRAAAIGATAVNLAGTDFEDDEDMRSANSFGRAIIGSSRVVNDLPNIIPSLFKKNLWTDAATLAKGQSPGQAYAMLLMDVDVNDPGQMQKYAGSSFYKYHSAVADASMRMFVDPTVVGGKAIATVRGAQMLRNATTGAVKVMPTKAITSQAHIEAAVSSTTWAKTNKVMEGKSAAEIEQRFFAGERHDPAISSMLEQAGDEATRTLLMRSFLGDKEAMVRLNEKSQSITNQMSRASGEAENLRSLDDNGFAIRNTSERQELLQREVDELYADYRNVKREAQAWGALQRLPTATVGGAVRTGITRSEFYQKNAFAAPVRVVFQMNPQRLVNMHDPGSYVQVKRMLDQTDLSQPRRDELLGAYMAGTDDITRQSALLQAEQEGVKSIAESAGMTPEQIQLVLDKAADGRGQAAQILKSRTYDGEGRGRVSFQDEDTFEKIEYPLMVTQNANVLPVADMRAVRKASTDIGKIISDHPSTLIGKDLLTSYYKIWRPATLLRLGWPQRVGADEQLRIISQIGALSQLGNLAHVAQEMGKSVGVAVKARRGEVVTKKGKEVREKGVSTKESVAKGIESYGFGTQDLKIGGYPLPGAFSTPTDQASVYKALVSSRTTFDKVAGQTEDGILKKLRSPTSDTDITLPSGRMFTGEYRSIEPHEGDYAAAWMHAVNHQIAQDPLGRKILEGFTPEDMRRWIRTTGEGRDYARRLAGVRVRDNEALTAWTDNLYEHVHAYTGDDAGLRALALGGGVSADDLVKAIPDASLRPRVHGQILEQAMGRGVVLNMISEVTANAWKALGQWPTDLLARQPFFASMYKAEATRLVKLLDDGTERLDAATIEHVSKLSRQYALGQTRKILYDLADESRFAEQLKFLSPFYMAWQEVMTRWAGIAIEKPQVAARVNQIWTSPERAGLVYDEKGIQVNPDGSGTNPMTGEPAPVGRERHIRFMLPEWMSKDIPGMDTETTVSINKKSFNILMNGGPGAGPPVGVAANEIVKRHPASADSLRWALPFGLQSTKDILTPTVIKKAETALSDNDENLTYRNQVLRIYFDKVTKYRQSVGGPNELPKPVYADAEAEANQMANIRFFTQLTLPVGVAFQSPYQIHIDAYRRGREAQAKDPTAFGVDEEGEPVTVDDWFYDEYGSEMFALTQSLSKSMDKVPATLEGWDARKGYTDLIEEFPEYGGLIIGEEGRGEFNKSVYKLQATTPVGPNSDFTQRERTSGDEAQANPDIKEGWLKYSRAMDLIDAERIQRGLPNLRVKEAQDIAAVKRNVVADLARNHPDWYQAYSTNDRSAMSRRITAFRKIAADPRMADKEGMGAMREYVSARDSILSELKERKQSGGSGTLTAETNKDVLAVWDNFTNTLVQRDLVFADTYHRWLDNDPVELGVTD